MYTTINYVDYTSVIAPGPDNGIQFSASLSDPNSTCDFVVDDIAQIIKLSPGMPVIIFDETIGTQFENIAPGDPYHTFAASINTTPAVNFVTNDFFSAAGGAGAQPNSWTRSGTLGSLIGYDGTYAAVKATFSNNAVGTGLLSQQSLKGYVQPGLSYCWSTWTIAHVATSNVTGILQLIFQDSSGNQLGPTLSTSWTPSTTQQRVSLQGTAPAGAAFATFTLGFQTTSSTNSGMLVWDFPQFEPMWFVAQGVSYPTDDCNYAHVNSVLMPDGTASRKCRIFTGYIEDLVVSYVGKQRYYTVSCASNSKYLENYGIVNASFSNQYDTQILSNILGSSQYSSVFATSQQNFFSPSSTTLVQGALIDSITYTNVTLREVLNSLADASGYQFYVDPYFYVWYVPPSFVSQVIQLSDNPDNINSFPYHDFSVEYDLTQPQNRVLVVGSKQQAAAITDTFSGDGSTTVFNLSEPPFNVHVVTVSGNNQRTGVDGVDNNNFGTAKTFKALINKQKQTIQFAGAPVAGSNNIVVTYTYEDQAIAQVLSADAIAQQGRPFDIVVNDSNITSTTAAKNRGLAELTKYAFPRTILTFSTLNIYMPVGSLVLFTCQGEGFSAAPFTIQTVQSVPQGGGIYKWDYTAGSYNPTIIDHIRNVHKAVKRSPNTANVVVINSIDVALFDSVHFNDSVTGTPGPAGGNYVYGTAKYGFSQYS